MSDKKLEIRADIMLRQWGWWAKGGLAKTDYPTKPPWQHLLGDDSHYRNSYEEECCNSIIAKLDPQRKAIVTTYYSVLSGRVKKRRDLPKETRLYINARGEHGEITTQRVNATIEATQDQVIKFLHTYGAVQESSPQM